MKRIMVRLSSRDECFVVADMEEAENASKPLSLDEHTSKRCANGDVIAEVISNLVFFTNPI